MNLSDEQLTHLAINRFWRVYNGLGAGFLESGYVGALLHEFRKSGLRASREVPTPLYYDGEIVATYKIDLLVEARLLIEVKACEAIRAEHTKQVFNYLRATDVELALLFNFGDEPGVRRFTLRNGVKRQLNRQK